ncbi:MAG: hypothetical protein OHK0039_44210 [Bacteroidia bacterium]
MQVSHNMFDDWEDLLLHKTYSQLSEAERAAISEAEYAALRALLHETRATLQANDLLEARPETLPLVQARLARTRWRLRLARVGNYHLPLWQVAAAVALLLVLLWGIERPGGGAVPATALLTDSTSYDTAFHQGVNLHEDSVFARFVQEAM